MNQLIEFFRAQDIYYKIVEHSIEKKTIKYNGNSEQTLLENICFYYIYFSCHGKSGELHINCIDNNAVILIKNMIENNLMNQESIDYNFDKNENSTNDFDNKIMDYSFLEKFKNEYIVVLTQCKHIIKAFLNDTAVQDTAIEHYLEVVTNDYKQFFYHTDMPYLCYEQFIHDKYELNNKNSILGQCLKGVVLIKKEVMVVFISSILNLLNGYTILSNNSLFTKNALNEKILKVKIKLQSFNNKWKLDAFANPCKTICYICDGVLKNFVCDNENYKQLNSEKNNSYYNYLNKNVESYPYRLSFELNAIKSKYFDIEVSHYDKNSLNFDKISGVITIELIGVDSKGIVSRFLLRENIISIFNKAQYIYSENIEYGDYFLDELIFKF